jgi:hypothetical protein
MKKFVSLVLIWLPLVVGCDWRVFDELAEQATVQTVEPPKNFSGTNFGQVVGPVLNDQGQVVSNVYLAGGNGTSPLATVTLEPDGTVSRQAFSFDEGVSVSAMAPLPSVDGSWRVVLSDGRFQTVSVFAFNPADGTHELRREATVSGGAEFGSALAAADLDGEAGMEIVVTSAQGLTVYDEQLTPATSRFFRYPDGFQVPTVQDLAENGNQSYLAVVRIDGAVTLAVGGHTTDTEGQPVWTVLLVPFSASFPEVTAGMLVGQESTPGSTVCTLVGGWIDADADTDLVVGTCDSTYVFLATAGGDAPYTTPRWILQDEAQDIGHVAGLVDLDADGTPELGVAEPDRPAGSGKNGKVMIYKLAEATEERPAPVTVLWAPENEKRFGSSLLSLKTAGGAELVVGGSNASYLFFLTGYPGDPDPRQDPDPL